MKVAVLGAGVVGVCTAWYLAEVGHEVVVVDRQPTAGRETSFANGGQVSVCHAEPWANPAAPLKVLRWLGHESSPLLWRLRADPAQWAWGLRFLRECFPARTRSNVEALIRLGLYSRTSLQELRQALALEYDQKPRGILHIYTDAKELERAIPQAEVMTRLGCTRLFKTADECRAIEPTLSQSRVEILGGTYTPDDESGDAYLFTQALAARCVQRGVEFRYDAEIAAIDSAAGRITSVRLANGEKLQADAWVLALGSYSSLWLRRLGLKAFIYPAKGYSITIPLIEGAEAPTVSLTDDGHKLVYSRLGNRLRVAGTAEFCGYDTELNAHRIGALLKRTRQLFPAIEPAGEIVEWAGLRPATPGNVPLIGPTRLRNLFLNSGHGTLGWTLACGSGRMVADLVSGKSTAIDSTPYRL